MFWGCALTPEKRPIASPHFEAKYETICREIRSQSGLQRSNPQVFKAAKLLSEQPSQFRSIAQSSGLPLLLPKFDLPILAIHLVSEKPATEGFGVPMVLEYDTSSAPYYPPEGLFIRSTLIAEKRAGGVQFRLTGPVDTTQIDGKKIALATDPSSPAVLLTEQAAILSKSGFASMIRPELMARKPRIYLLEPYDPNKIPFLMAHGLQSTPVAFAHLIETLLKDPYFRKNYQIWQFHYANGDPLLTNALTFRRCLNQVIDYVDPSGKDPATQRIVVIGHSMGGVISHTLVSSSGEKVWSSVMNMPLEKLKGDPQHLKTLDEVMHFQRDPRVTRVIFVCAPHHGSGLADSLAGMVGNALSRLPRIYEKGFQKLEHDNPGAMTEAGRDFYLHTRFSAIRTLSPNNPALIALSELPIEVPYHSIIGQAKPGPKEEGSDGVVPYKSSHLEGAESELVVHAGHGAFNNPDAAVEILRILKLEAARN